MRINMDIKKLRRKRDTNEIKKGEQKRKRKRNKS